MRQIHRQITDRVLDRFALERVNKNQLRTLPNTDLSRLAWLQNDARGQSERELLLKMLRSLYWLGNHTFAENLRHIAVVQMSSLGLDTLAFRAPFADIPPLLADLGRPVAPAPAPITPRPSAQVNAQRYQAQIQEPQVTMFATQSADSCKRHVIDVCNIGEYKTAQT